MNSDNTTYRLQTEFFEHEIEDGGIEVSSDYYYLPEHLQQHIHYITPGIKASDITNQASIKPAFKRDICKDTVCS